MKLCEQTPGLSVLAHGQSVQDYYQDLRDHCINGAPLRHEWKLPEWILSPALWAAVLDEQTVETYQVFHDCGKPYCLEVDQEGRSHFPDHANVSAQVWRSIGGDESVARLISLDMAIHLLKAEDLDAFCQRPEAATLLITGFCEIHSNAAMFGGIDSSSFKMKWKHIDRRGKQIVKML
jgi:hypothetical protein